MSTLNSDLDDWYCSQMKELASYDTEVAHAKADDLLLEMLRSFGMLRTADEFEKMEKWYA